MNESRAYHIHVDAGPSPLPFDLRELLRYRDLIWLLTKREFQLSFKQTILGPFWIVIRPLLSSLVYLVLFGTIAGLSTAGLPKLLFYLCSSAVWGFFSGCINRNSSAFLQNARVYGKVYFPRLAIPLSNVLSTGIHFLIQMATVSAFGLYYLLRSELHPNWAFFPLMLPLLLVVAATGLGLGMIISGVTAKYRDLSFFVGTGMRLFMYVTPVVYPLSQLESGWLRHLVLLNPMTAPMEAARWILLGVGDVHAVSVVSSLVFCALALYCGLAVFRRVERTFIDTV